MSDQTDPVARLRVAANSTVTSWAGGAGGPAMQPMVVVAQSDLRAALAELDELRDFVPPKCSHCGERGRDGHYTEDDDTWLCANCHVKLAAGGVR